VVISKNLQLTEPVFLRNLLVYPIRASDTNGMNISSINETMLQEKGEFRELDPPDINRIAFHNQGDDPVLMLDGEEIIGSLQNRIVADSMLIPARSNRNIPVVCVEEGRWDDIGSFQTGYCSYPGIRAILSRRGKEETGLQKRIWKEIERKLTVTKTLSTTSSMHDIYGNLEDEVNRYIEDFEGLNHDTVGFIGVAGKKTIGFDLFLNPAAYRTFEQKLIRSYALDAIEHRTPGRGKSDILEFFDGIRDAINTVDFSRRTQHFAVKGNRFAGQGLFYKGHVIHLSVFPR
jgi:hypothetical protein